MRPKNTRKSIDHQKTVKNHPKSNIITLKAPKKPYSIPCFQTQIIFWKREKHFLKKAKSNFIDVLQCAARQSVYLSEAPTLL
jgi:hypothetical protein